MLLACSFLVAGQACGSSDSTPPGGAGGNANLPDASAGGAAGTGGVGGAAGTSSSGGNGGNGGSNAGGGGAGATGGSAGTPATGTGGASGNTGGSGNAGTGGAVGSGGNGAAGSGGAMGTGGRGGADSGVVVVPDAGGCTTPPPPSPLIGWASQNGGTTGGGDVAPSMANSAASFNSLIGGTAARVIYVTGNFSGSFGIGSNKTIVGLCGATIQGHLEVSNNANVIVRNLKIVGNNCTDSPNDCSAGADAVTIQQNSHNVWFDHCDISDGSDGNLDTTSGSDFVTISWTKFHYSSMRTDVLAGTSGHRFSNLIGSADTVTTDAGHLNVTFHHDWWAENVNQRMPRTRFGKIHVFNNLYTAAGNSYCTNSGIQTSVLVENNVYMGVNNPLSPDANGNMVARGNIFPGSTGTQTAPTPMVPVFTPPYSYLPLDPTTNLAATIMSQAGPH
jgi:pectate lyase